MSLFRWLLGSFGAVALAMAGPPTNAQDISGRTVRFVVPYPAGGAGDALTRLLGQAVAESKGPSLVIENRPGASGIIGTEVVARAAPDGATLLLVENPFILSAVLRPSVNYNPVSSFEPICYVADTPAVLAVSSVSEIHSVPEFLDAARAKPGSISYASTGPASIVHIAGELLKRDSRVDLTYVPYPGSPPAVNAVLGGHVTAVIANYSDLKAQLEAGQLRPLAVPAKKRVEPLPDVPTLAEVGFPGIEASVWFGIVAPAGTQKDTLSQFAAYFSAAIKAPDVKRKLAVQGLFPVLSCGAEFGNFIRMEFEKYGLFAREFNLKFE
jgi:tripartite-type tricarboxylate transporter receptor subunit TctC